MIVSGFFGRVNDPWAEWFYHVWAQNLWDHARPIPTRIFIVRNGQVAVPPGNDYGIEPIEFDADPGSCNEILHGKVENFMPTCPAVWMAGAWLCYLNNADFIYLEQDVLAFGPWVQRMYEDLGEKKVIFGRNRMQGAATALFLVKRDYIPQFVHAYLSEGPETHINRIPETKFLRMEGRHPEAYCRYSFGYDKDRPFNPKDRVWMAQKFTRTEMLRLESLGLVKCAGMPDVPLFSNNP